MKQIGIFSGSFNPVHIGHLALANWICVNENLDEVWFLITPQNPLKERGSLMDDQLRLEMVRAAIGEDPRFKASDFEFLLPQPTYTIDTLRALGKAFPQYHFIFIMGADNWTNIQQWKEYDQLIANYPIRIYPRPGYSVQIPASYANVKQIEAPVIEISSTFIRSSFAQGKDVRFFLPEKIRPYFTSKTQEALTTLPSAPIPSTVAR